MPAAFMMLRFCRTHTRNAPIIPLEEQYMKTIITQQQKTIYNWLNKAVKVNCQLYR